MRPLDELIARSALKQEDAFATIAGRSSWQAWVATTRRYRAQLRLLDAGRIGLFFPPRPDSFAALAAIILENRDVYLIDELAGEAVVSQIAVDHSLEVLIEAAPEGLQLGRFSTSPHHGPCQGWITLFTSGTSGTPKAVRHNWETLARPVRHAAESAGERWLLSYRPHLYAGLQVLMHCMVNHACLVLPPRDSTPPNVVRLMREAAVTHVSATPSYWRWLMTLGGHGALEGLGIKQITLGGETADQAVLDTLKAIFPQSRIVHIYATSEAGRCFSVSDGLQGFPARFLEAPSPDGIELKVLEGELHVRSANAMLAQDSLVSSERDASAWIPTGDLVEKIGDRFHFVARRTDIINVGGNKVDPWIVEQVVRSVPGVADARVYAKKSSLVGQMVACEITVLQSHDPDQVKRDVQRRCLEQLANVQRPRVIEVVPAITLSSAGKKVRQPLDRCTTPVPASGTT
jgi:acyl-coenzyme A synthetase/AMP-(fatty) acid ligase